MPYHVVRGNLYLVYGSYDLGVAPDSPLGTGKTASGASGFGMKPNLTNADRKGAVLVIEILGGSGDSTANPQQDVSTGGAKVALVVNPGGDFPDDNRFYMDVAAPTPEAKADQEAALSNLFDSLGSVFNFIASNEPLPKVDRNISIIGGPGTANTLITIDLVGTLPVP